MDYLQQLIRRAKFGLFLIILLENLVLLGAWWLGGKILELSGWQLLALIGGLALIQTAVIATGLGNLLMQPVKALWQTILHLAPEAQPEQAPQLQSLRFGRELVTMLTSQLHQLISLSAQAAELERAEASDLSHNFIAQNLPLPLLVLDASETVTFANEAAATYLGMKVADLKGKNVYMVLDMAFPSQNTFDSWLKATKANNATASKSWERVRLNVRDTHPARLFDLAAYYNRGNPDKIETILTLFDHTKQYSQDDQAVSFIALTVHELRTPLTLLRGYIEVFEEELESGNIDPELRDFMQKMRAQAEQLTSFVNNILNVARIDDDQLELRLEEENWPAILKASITALSLQAKVRGITLRCRLATDLPAVGVDRLSIQEVISNLIDNAIKYSGTSKVINIDSHLTKDGLVETTVQDFGVGIPNNIMQHLFTKFYRDHRNRAQIGGTGLGLYLSKAIVDAHGGSLWVRSKPGEGSTFGFTIVPYAKLAEEQKRSGDKEIARNAHGWIKNHSLYRR